MGAVGLLDGCSQIVELPLDGLDLLRGQRGIRCHGVHLSGGGSPGGGRRMTKYLIAKRQTDISAEFPDAELVVAARATGG
jgi:hypothetical protein